MNKSKIDQITGEITFGDDLLPISQDIWIPSPNSDKPVDIDTLCDEHKNMIEESKTLVNYGNTGHGEKRIFTISVDDISPEKVEEYIKQIQEKIKING